MIRENRTKGGCFGRLAALLLFTLCTLLLAGCSRDGVTASLGGYSGEADYSPAQIRLIAVTERNRYQAIYTDALWSAVADAEGNTFEKKLKDQIEQFLVELEAVNRMADEQNITLTSQEEDSIKSLADPYYGSLTAEDLSYTGITREEIEELYRRYYRADKAVSELTGGADLEVSDAEAKVIEVQRIELDSQEEADQLLAQLQEGQTDFGSLAAKSSRNSQISFTLEWTAQMDELTSQAFALEQDQVGSVIQQDGKYYIQKCTNAYDREATAARKEVLAQQKKTDTFRRLYDPFMEQHTVKLKAGAMDAVDFSQGADCTTDDFFQVYRAYFGEK